MKKNLLNLTALLSGIISIFAFAPFDYYWIAYLTPAALLLTWLNASKRQIVWRAYLFGVGYFGFGVYWVYISIHYFGDANIFISTILTVGLLLFLALFFLVQGLIFVLCMTKNKAYNLLIIFPASWVFAEWIREWAFTGFPWIYIGSSQTNGLLAGFMPIVGPFGESFLTVLIAGLVVFFFLSCGLKRLFSLITIIAILSAGAGLATISWTKPIGKPVKVTAVQGDIPQSVKWNPETIPLSLFRYQKLTEQHWGSQLIVWPESAIPLPLPYAENYLAQLNTQARKHHTTILLGIPVPLLNSNHYYNAMTAVGEAHGMYYKRHLVPFGEYLPFAKYLQWFTKLLQIPMSTFVPGNMHQKLIRTNGVRVAPFICYEIAFSNLVRSDLPQATLLVTISDDAWFGHSFAAWQHLQIGQMQALSTGRPLLFSTNNGVTAFVNAHGQIIKTAPRYVATTLTDTLQPMQGSTPWVIMGNWPVILFLLFLLIVPMILRFRRRH